MGCSFSYPRLRVDNSPNIFKVFNVNDQGDAVINGKIEITESYLILYQRSKDPVKWPLRSLRRYGFDSELFSFESGRRCPTGPGIYAFKCKRAEALFNLLQDYIQRAGQEDHARDAHTGTYGFIRPEPNMQSSPDPRYNQPQTRQTNGGPMAFIDPTFRGDNVPTMPSPTSSGPHYANNAHEYVNTPQTPEGPKINYAILDLPPSSTMCPEKMTHSATGMSSRNSVVEVVDVESSKQIFVNLPVFGDGSGDSILERRLSARRKAQGSEESEEIGPSYANLDLKSDKSSKAVVDNHSHHSIGSSPSSPLITPTHTPLHTPSHTSICVPLTPAHVQFYSNNTPSSPNSQTSSNPESPGRRTESYATIDFNRTAALSNSTKNANRRHDSAMAESSSSRSKDTSSRKTRHDANLTDICLSVTEEENVRKTRHDVNDIR